MVLITERFHDKRLKKFKINIKTKYKDGEKILERNSDNSQNDDIKKGIRLEKHYYKDGRLLHKVFNFDPRIEYTFISQQEENSNISCPNCGNKGIVKDFTDGCPYCGTYYNVDYTNKDLGTKYHLDNILHNENYNHITLLVDILVCAIILLIYIFFTGRTFNIYDMAKAVIGSLVLGVALFYVFYMADAMIVVLPIKMYKKRQNDLQIAFWDRMKKIGVEKTTFYNNFNYELQNYYYNDQNKFNSNVIDYDILDYLKLDEFKDKNEILNIRITINIRIVKLENNIFKTTIEKKEFVLKRSQLPLMELKGGVNIINCHNCGASVDVTKGVCEYCGSKNNYLQEWYLINE